MQNCVRLLDISSIILSFASVLCLSYRTLNRFHGREAGWTADGAVPKTPEYEAWRARSEKFARAGLVFIALATLIQIIAVCISGRD